MTIQQYIDNLNQRYKLGNATEHTFRGDLQQLLESLVPNIRATNEPKRQSCGAPDYILTKKDNSTRNDSGIPVGFIEAKDIGDKDLEGAKKTGNKEQFDRYKASLNNLIFTDYLDFHLYRDGQLVTNIKIAEITPNGIIPLATNHLPFTNLIKDFCSHIGQTIKSSKKLAEMMAGKARLLSDVIEKALTSDETNKEDSTLKDQMNAFQQILIHDITPKGFADVYAQTIAYGMFAARLHDPTLPTFSRQEAAELIPKSNPFLRKLFGYIAGPDIDDRIKWIVDSLVEIFLACNVEEILKNYGKSTKMEDPIIHFYETFLSEYDPKLRKARGVWYTPAPVVNFIVRAVDDILKTEFDLPQGLADNSKTKIKVDVQGKKVEQEVHKVQILDPATGTGTFLAEVVKHIHKKFEGQQGIWSNYVETHLLPRLNGFELLMASYAMAHLKLDLLLTETGYKPTTNQRFRVYLTNSLEEHHQDTGTLFANWLSTEANEANHIKRDTPVMCVIGNPPYSGESANKGEWIMSLMEDYKKEPGGKEKLKERNPKMINDDYVKFIRYGQQYIEKNGEGILAFINPHGFIDNGTFRGMRWSLLNCFDKMYILDLNGNVKKKKIDLKGNLDENVFDITTGVSINIFVKSKKNNVKEIYYNEIIGKRESKYDFLNNSNIKDIHFKKISPFAPEYFLCNKEFEGYDSYIKGIEINKLFNFCLSGLSTKNDEFCISIDKEEINKKIIDLKELNIDDLKNKYNLINESSSWSLSGAINDVKQNFSEKKIIQVSYRPFDSRFTFYSGKSMGFMGRPKGELGKHLINKNYSLVTLKKSRSNNTWNFIGVSNLMICEPTTITSLDGNYAFPLYLYPETNGQQTIGETTERTPNLNLEIVNKIAEKLGLKFLAERHFDDRRNLSHSNEISQQELRNDEAERHFDDRRNLLHSNEISQQELRNDEAERHFDDRRNLLHSNEISQQELRNDEAERHFDDRRNLPHSNEISQQELRNDDKTFAPIDILDYIYAVLHSPTYREKYKEFLKIDFPRVPYPKTYKVFEDLIGLGSQLRQIHLLESPIVEKYITQYPIDGENKVIKPTFIFLESSNSNPTYGRVYINDTQYFGGVPIAAWEFYIGGYQPAQKWLKDRKGRTLEYEDILHYQKIIVALTETDKLMKEIDKIKIE